MITQTQKRLLIQNVLTKAVNSIPEVSNRRPTPIPFKHYLEVGITTVSNWFRRHQDRRDLAKLNDHILKDIGLTRWDVRRESEKPFWKA